MKKLMVLISFVFLFCSVNAQVNEHIVNIDYRVTVDTCGLLFVKNDTVIFEPMLIPPHTRIFTGYDNRWDVFFGLGAYSLEDMIQIIKDRDYKGSIYSNDYQE